MTLPKDPEKRAIYLQQMSERQKARMADPDRRKAASEATKRMLADPEKKKFIDDKRREALKSLETRAKMSASAIKRHSDLEARQELDAKISATMRTPESRAKRSEKMKQHFADPEARKKTSETTKAAMARPEVREHTSQAQKERHANDPEFSARHSEFMKRLYAETDMREIVSARTKEAMVEVLARPEFRANLSVAMAKAWNDPEYQRKVLDGRIAKLKSAHTSIEVAIAALLDVLGIEYQTQVRMGRYVVDFYIPSKNLVIECDGDYWHSTERAKVTDARKDAYLLSKGYTILRLPEHRIKANDLTDFYEAVS